MLTYLNKKLRRLCSKLRRSTAIHHNHIKSSKSSSNGSYNDDGDTFSGIHKSHGNESIAIYPNGGEKTTTTDSSSCNNVNVIYNSSSSSSSRPIRVATFNAALFSMAPAVSQSSTDLSIDDSDEEIREFHRRRRSSIISRTNSKSLSVNDPPKGILKQSSSPLRCVDNTSNNTSESAGNSNKQREKFAKSRLRVSINLPDNEISLGRSRRLEGFEIKEGLESGIVDCNNKLVIKEGKKMKNSAIGLRSIVSFPNNNNNYYYKQNNNAFDDNDYGRGGINNNNNNNRMNSDGSNYNNYKQHERTVLDVLKEIDADFIALQDVKAEEEKEMKPLSDLASGLGMFYVFAESWAPEYGNALLSKWPIKHCHVQKIFNDADFRNVLKTTVDVPEVGDVNLYCTLLDHLDEEWRMKQINAIIQSDDDHAPHILLGGLNSLDQTDYSLDRWTDIIKYYEDIGKPTPKAEVLKFLKTRRKYIDAKDFAGECESVVIIAKGQSVQGTCKYGTRVDYIMASPGSPYKFIPGSYSVLSSKGTSDHHIVKVDLVKVESIQDIATKKIRQRHNHLPIDQPKKRVVRNRYT